MNWGHLDLNAVWFVLIGVLFTGYAMLDGFDLGVGALHLFTRDDAERRVMLNAIGPVWDGNEVWLVTGGGALFAAFPNVYATVFSGFFMAFTLLLVALIFRGVATFVKLASVESYFLPIFPLLLIIVQMFFCYKKRLLFYRVR